jgi:hypothetical protein
MGIEDHLLRLAQIDAHEPHATVAEPACATFTVTVTPLSTMSWAPIGLAGPFWGKGQGYVGIAAGAVDPLPQHRP